MSAQVKNIVFFFVDGLGVGEDDSRNPIARVRGPCLGDFLSAPPTPAPRGGVRARPDACLGVDGLPQSATGQTTLFTGVNAARVLGRHLFGFPNKKLRELLLDRSILRAAALAGLDARFLNAFRPIFFDRHPGDDLSGLSASTVAAHASGAPFFDLDALREGRCLYQDFTNRHLRTLGFDVPLRSPEEAGEIFAATAQEHDFVLYEYFHTDRVGHGRDLDLAVKEIDKLERFLGSALPLFDFDRTLLVLSSDHGNIEDLSFGGHTKNPALTVVWGPDAAEGAARLGSIQDVPRLLLDTAGVESPPPFPSSSSP
jgi:hypothetical protein